MKYSEIISEEKVRLDPACWHNKKIGNPKTKVKGGVRVNNCVPKEGVAEGQEVDASVVIGKLYDIIDHAENMIKNADFDRQVQYATTVRDRAVKALNMIKTNPGAANSAWKYFQSGQQGVTEGVTPASISKVLRLIQRHRADWFDTYGIGEVEDTVVDLADMGQFSGMSATDALELVGQELESLYGQQGVEEGFNAEYDDEAGMAQGSLHTLKNAVEGLQDVIDAGDNLPEWCQEKISLAEDYLVTVWDYIQSEKAQGIDPEITEEFDMIERIIESIAAHNGVDAEEVWSDLESLTEDELYAFAVTSQLNEDWSKVNKKDKTDGMSRKAVKAYRRENPGSKLQTAVTTKPSKLKKGSKASKRRKSYCSRSRGQMKMHNISCAKTPDKAICKARRRWNC